jgi:hypothetical protein
MATQTIPLTDADRQRLVNILGMLGSEHQGERDAAGLQAEVFRKKHGLSWVEMVSGKTVYVGREVPMETIVYVDRIVYVERTFGRQTIQRWRRSVALPWSWCDLIAFVGIAFMVVTIAYGVIAGPWH